MPLNRLIDSGQPFPVLDIQQTPFRTTSSVGTSATLGEEATANLNFDAVIIRSGMYGGYCAAKHLPESEEDIFADMFDLPGTAVG